MQILKFKYDFGRVNGMYVTKDIIMFRRPIELYDLSTGETLATFTNLDDALSYVVEGRTIAEIVEGMDELTAPSDEGGRGSSSSSPFKGRWEDNNGNERDYTEGDLPARMNVRLGGKRTYGDMVRAFTEAHGSDEKEHGIVVDAEGFATIYRHGNKGSISGLVGKKTEIAIHNHPRDGWPTFSKADVVNTALSSRRGIVAVSTTKGRDKSIYAETAKYAGTYTFIKGGHFKATEFVKAVNKAYLTGKDYNDAVDKWLKKNQKKYGYTYTYQRNK